MITYAQAREDVLLHRALNHIPYTEGFYIDVGGYHPDDDSVTRHFYDHGWHGVNVECSVELFPAFATTRPRDINLQVAVSDTSGEVTFHQVEGQLGTLVDKFAERHVEAGYQSHQYTVPAMTLTQICETYAQREIHFLKIDIEGHEAAAVRGMDFARFRPWVMVIESYEPNNLSVATYPEWEGIVLGAGYRFAYGDALNRYYVADEHADLLRFFMLHPDNYRQSHDVRRIQELEHQVAALTSQLDQR